MDLEFTFAVPSRNIEAELLSETLGTRDRTDTAMLIPFTTDFDPTALQGTEDVSSVSIVVFYGVYESRKALQAIEKNRLRE